MRSFHGSKIIAGLCFRGLLPSLFGCSLFYCYFVAIAGGARCRSPLLSSKKKKRSRTLHGVCCLCSTLRNLPCPGEIPVVKYGTKKTAFFFSPTFRNVSRIDCWRCGRCYCCSNCSNLCGPLVAAVALLLSFSPPLAPCPCHRFLLLGPAAMLYLRELSLALKAGERARYFAVKDKVKDKRCIVGCRCFVPN